MQTGDPKRFLVTWQQGSWKSLYAVNLMAFYSLVISNIVVKWHPNYSYFEWKEKDLYNFYDNYKDNRLKSAFFFDEAGINQNNRDFASATSKIINEIIALARKTWMDFYFIAQNMGQFDKFVRNNFQYRIHLNKYYEYWRMVVEAIIRKNIGLTSWSEWVRYTVSIQKMQFLLENLQNTGLKYDTRDASKIKKTAKWLKAEDINL